MRFIIDFKNTASDQQVQDYLAAIGATVVKTFNKFEKIYVVESTQTPPAASIVEHCVNDDIDTINLHDFTVTFDASIGRNTLTGDVLNIDVTADENWWKTYSLERVDFNSAINTIDRKGDNCTVYVLDSGIKTSHPDFVGANVTNLWSFTDDAGIDNDTNGHGTAIASVICGRSCGITNATVKGVKIFQSGVPTKQSDLIAALDSIYADHVAGGLADVGSVVNCSWTIDRNLLIESKIQQMIDAGILFVCAAGNSGMAIENVTPAAMGAVLTVGAYNSDFKPCSFSNYTGTSAISLTPGDVNSGALDGWAPGENIRAATLTDGYASVAGTSIAAGIHSAVVAYNMNWNLPGYVAIREPKEFLTIGSFRRENLLDLSDPRYANSVNKISTIYWIETLATGYSFFSKAPSGGVHNLNMFNAAVYEKVEVLGQLPNNLKLDASGRLWGRAPEIANDQDNYTHDSIPLIATRRSGEIENHQLEIVTYRNTLSIDQLGITDPVLNVKLAIVTCTSAQPVCEDIEGCDSSCGIPSPCLITKDPFACPGAIQNLCSCP